MTSPDPKRVNELLNEASLKANPSSWLAERIAIAEQERDKAQHDLGLARQHVCPDETVEERPDGTTVYRAGPDDLRERVNREAECTEAVAKVVDDLRARVERLEVAVAGHLARTNPGGYAGDWSVRELLAKEAIARDVAKREEGE